MDHVTVTTGNRRLADPSHPQYRADIDGLRAFAVLSVVAFHAFPLSVPGGFVGVDIFFVISGYLISSILFQELGSQTFFTSFYARRIRRIFPALIVVLVSCYVYGWFRLLPDEFKQLGKHTLAGAAFVSNIVLWRDSSYFDTAANTKPLLHLWSLGIEEQFYIVWPLLLGFAWKRRLNLLTLTAGLLLLSFVVNVLGVREHSVATFYLPQSRFWELLAGSALAYFTLHPRQISPEALEAMERWCSRLLYADGQQNRSAIRNLSSTIGLCLLLAAIFGTESADAFPGWWAVLPVAGAALLIGAGSRAWVNRLLLSNRVAVWFGLISYPLYLWHWPLLTFARLSIGGLPSLETRIAVVTLSVVLAWFTYTFFERPFRSGRFRRGKVVALSLAMSVLAALGGYTSAHNGIASRFPAIVTDLMQFKYDSSANPWRSGSCFLNIEQDEKEFYKCPAPPATGRPTLLLWGDSHAASMYQGFAASFSSKYSVVQRTASACLPIIGLVIPQRPHCASINNSILAYARAEKPDKVVLAADWPSYDGWPQVSSTIEQLKAAGIKHIELVGPLPQWHESLPKQLYLAFQSSNPHAVPYRMNSGLNPKFLSVDIAMAAFARAQGVEYVSPAAILCNEQGCLARLGDRAESLITSDNAHLTSLGAQYLIASFPQD